MFLINLNAEIVACMLSFRKSRHKPNLESTSKYGFSPDLKKWRRSEHAHASYPGLFFRPPGLSPYMGREERRVQGLDYVSDQQSDDDHTYRGSLVIFRQQKRRNSEKAIQK